MLCGVSVGLVAISSLASLAPAQGVEEVIARANEARGGVERLRTLQAVRMTGRMTIASQANAPVTQITMEKKRKHRSRFEFKAQGMTGVQAYDGREAWGIPPVAGARPERLPEEMAGELVNEADIEGPLVDYKAKGHEVALVGREKLDGKMWPHTIEVGPKGRPEKQLVTFEKIEVDPQIDDARFRMPRR
jgi:hypothetical protein